MSSFPIATSESWVDKITNKKQEKKEWHRVVLFRKTAEIAGKYLHKGSLVYIEGKLATRKWTDNNGVERYITEIVGSNLIMISGNNQQKLGQPKDQSDNQYQQPVDTNNPDDIPF